MWAVNLEYWNLGTRIFYDFDPLFKSISSFFLTVVVFLVIPFTLNPSGNKYKNSYEREFENLQKVEARARNYKKMALLSEIILKFASYGERRQETMFYHSLKNYWRCFCIPVQRLTEQHFPMDLLIILYTRWWKRRNLK